MAEIQDMKIYLCFAALTVIVAVIYALVRHDIPKRHRAWLIWILMLGVLSGTTLLATGQLIALPGTAPP